MSDQMSIDAAKATSTASTATVMAAQAEILAEGQKLNIMMAWFQMALGLAGKIAGR